MNANDRAIAIGKYLVEKGGTLREVGSIFGVSKTTAHNDLRYRLSGLDSELQKKALEVLRRNGSDKHIRGGEATKKKYVWRR